jgi:hypothetical protein
VWDLRISGLSFPEIAQAIYPIEYLAHPKRQNPIVQRVADHYDRAKELINGGYKELA